MIFISIVLEHIRKSFYHKTVLEDVSMEIKEGKITGILGDNGSGKTTLMKIICGLYSCDSGQIKNLIFKDKVLDIATSIEYAAFPLGMTVLQNFKYFLDLSIEKNADFQYYIKKFKIDFLDVKFGKLSAGMRQKVGMAYVFLKKSKILLLDEITNGLDEKFTQIFYKELKKYVKENHTYVLISSHKINEIQNICDEVYVLSHGRVERYLNLADERLKFPSKLFIFKNEIFAQRFMECFGFNTQATIEGCEVTMPVQSEEDFAEIVVLASQYHLVNILNGDTILEQVYYGSERRKEYEKRDI